MIRNIVKDIEFLKKPSSEVLKEDLFIRDDLIDTLRFHRSHCVGMAANMIGYSKNMIIFINEEEKMEVILEPKIIKAMDPYETEEGCLSLTGVRKTTRYQNIVVEYYDGSWKKHRQIFTGQIAQIIQHEVDHLYGVVI